MNSIETIMYFSHLIFDFDGTLFDTRKDIVGAINHTRSQFNLPELEFNEVINHVGRGMSYLIAECFPEMQENLIEVESVLLKYYKVHHSDFTVPYPGVMETLPKFHQDLFIISNKPRELIIEVLDTFKLKKYFKSIVGGECLPERKPHPMTLEKIEEEFPGKREKMLMIGDLDPDLKLAKNTGIKSTFCKYGFIGSTRLRFDFSINEFNELLDITK